MDKSWVHKDRWGKEYEDGARLFLDHAFEKGVVTEDSKMKCPCRKCNNVNYKVRSEIFSDLILHGMMRNYTTWFHHGERLSSTVSSSIAPQDTCFEYVFDYPEELDHCIRRKLNEYWRDHKHTMKLAGYDPNRSEAQNLANRPADVVESQWPPLVKMWNTKKNKELAAQNKQNRSKQTVQHTGGSKPHMEYAREMLAETGRFPERHEIFRRTRTKKRKTADPSELVMDPVAAEQYDRMVEIRNKANQPGSGVVLSGRNDAFAAVMGPDRRGRVRCFGSTVKPKQIWGESSSSSKVIQLTEENAMLKQRVAELEAQVAALPPNQNNEGLEEM